MNTAPDSGPAGMLDLHCHLLPGIDDGATDLEMSLAMARMAVADGVSCIACTPHIYPGLYENDADGIRRAVHQLQDELDRRDIPLRLLVGADVHLEPDLAGSIADGRIPTVAGSRYLLLEPPHHVAPPRFEASLFELQVAGYVPVITHPERLSWLPDHYPLFERAARAGVWMQVTAGSLAGRFGRQPRYWAERMLDDGIAHILATDAHHPQKRPPLLTEGRDAAARRVGEDEATHMVVTRPQAIVDDLDPADVPAPHPGGATAKSTTGGFWRTLLGRR